MTVLITKTTGTCVKYEHVIKIKSTFNYRLGARMDLMIEGKRNRVRIPVIDIQYLSILG